MALFHFLDADSVTYKEVRAGLAGIGFNPTGGVTLENLSEWLAMPQVKAVGGTWIAKSSDIADGNWKQITANAKQAVELVKQLRGDA